jgi:thioredoxin-like negative regulator of GroEL
MSARLQPVTDRDFDRVVHRSPVPVLIEFWKPSCGHCRALTAELEKLQTDLGGRILVLAMNADENYQILAELEVTSLPALALYDKGEFQRFIGGLGKKEEILKQLPLGAD